MIKKILVIGGIAVISGTLGAGFEVITELPSSAPILGFSLSFVGTILYLVHFD